MAQQRPYLGAGLAGHPLEPFYAPRAAFIDRRTKTAQEPPSGFTAADIDAARKDAVEKHETRRTAILALPEAKGRERLAAYLADSPDSTQTVAEVREALSMAVLDGPNTWPPPAAPAAAAPVAAAGPAPIAPRLDLVAAMKARVQANGQTPVEQSKAGVRPNLAERMREQHAAQHPPGPEAGPPGAGLGGPPPAEPDKPPRANLAENMRQRFGVKAD